MADCNLYDTEKTPIEKAIDDAVESVIHEVMQYTLDPFVDETYLADIVRPGIEYCLRRRLKKLESVERELGELRQQIQAGEIPSYLINHNRGGSNGVTEKSDRR